MENKWYSADNKPLDIPTFQDLQDVTGQVFDDAGLYIGPAELPKQQLVIDNVTKRQYYAPKEYTENAIRYAEAKRNEYFKPEDWFGMENIKADYTLGEQVIGGASALGKSVTGLLGQLPTKIVYTGAVFANQLSKAIAQGNSTDIAKMKNGMLVEQENLYRMSMKNWENTLHKYGLINEPEIQYMTGGKIGSMIGDIGGSLLTAAIVSSAGGLPAVAAVFGSNQFADVMEEGLAKGLSHDKAFAAAWKAALAEGGLEAAGFRLWRSAATVSKSFRNKMLAFAWEGAQESSQQTAESIITNYYGIREQTFMEIMADVLLSGLIGGVVGFAGASLSGQVEQRNIALRRDIGMTDRGQIVTPKAQEVKEVQPVTTTKEAEKAIIDNEIAQAKKTGDNKLYNIVKYSANDHGITDEATIDKMYPVARKAIADGATLDDLTDILANQIVAYNNQLENGQIDTKATQKAVEQIKLVTDPNRYEEWKESRKSELEKIGFTKEQAGTLTEHLSTIAQRLSERLGFDITKKKGISFGTNLSERAGTRGQIELGKTVAKVALNKNADPTTVEHEFFHYIDRVVLDAAKEGNVEAQKLVKKRDEIIKKAKAELKKQGVKDMPIDEEILASAYEKWLWQGAKSEDATEQKLFEAIRDFFREVYDTVKGLIGIRITHEADAFFRSMTGADTMYQPIQEASFEAAEGIKEQVKKDIEDYENGTMPKGKVVSLGFPSAPLLSVGVPNFELKLKQKTIKKDTKTKHKVKMETFKNLPSLLADPLLILKSDTETGSFIAVLNDTDKNGKRVIAAIDPEGGVEINYVDSVYGKDNKYWFKTQVEKGNLLYIDENEALKESSHLYLRGVPYKASTNSILTKDDIVKGETLFQKDIKYKNGKADINSPEFKKWFGNSKVVDENGKPLVVYHGTPNATFEEFRTPAYFTKDKEYAEGYQRQGASYLGYKQTSEKPDTYAVYLSIKKPFDTRDAIAKQLFYNEYYGQRGVGSNLSEKGLPDWMEAEDLSEWLVESHPEYDGLIVDEGGTGGYGMPVIDRGEAYLPFSPNQIKSVYNRGTFDTESQNIYYQQETNEQLYRNDQALKEGSKVLDKAPTNEQVENELENIRNQQVGDVVVTKEGFGLGESIGDFVLTLRQRVGVIDKRLKYAFDRLDFNEKMRESNYGKRVLGFIKKYRKLTETQKQELDYLINNHLSERVREFARQNDMLAEYEEARTLLDELFEEGNKAGMDMGFLQEYFPTKVNDYEGLISYLKGTDKWSKIEMALNQIDPNHQMSEEDRANAINNILRGYNRLDPVGKKGFQKERKIFHKTPEIMKFYAHADEALMRYVSGMSSALSIRTAFNVKGAFSAADSIGGIVDELIKSGKITHKEEAFITKMLRARLNYARTAPMVALLKNFGYLGTMNNLTSAITQIGDLYANFYKYNFGTAMKALFGKSEVTKQDLHIDSIWEEFSDDSWSSVAVNKLFSAIGLNKMDAFGKNTAINGAWIDLKERLKNNDPSLLEDLTAAFGSGAKKVMEDIKNNNITEDIKLMIWSQLADTQPIGRSGVPVGYLNNPHGRIIYQLKTYTINQLSLFYADGIYKIKKGMATKNKKLFLQGIGNTAKLALLLTIFNASADAIKNLIMGRKIDISDTLLSNMLWNIGVSKYTFYRGQRDGYARALLENYLLPPQISMGDDAYMDIKKIATGKRKPSDTVAVTYVPFGRMWYWWFGGGRTQEKKKGNKPFEVEL